MNFPFSLNIIKITLSDLCVVVIMVSIRVVLSERSKKYQSALYKKYTYLYGPSLTRNTPELK